MCPQSSDISLLRCQPAAHKDKTVVEKEFNHVRKDMLYGKKNKVFNAHSARHQEMLLVTELDPGLYQKEYFTGYWERTSKDVYNIFVHERQSY